jgi:hypothetical protein
MISILTEVWCGIFQGDLIFLFIISRSLHNLRIVSGFFLLNIDESYQAVSETTIRDFTFASSSQLTMSILWS